MIMIPAIITHIVGGIVPLSVFGNKVSWFTAGLCWNIVVGFYIMMNWIFIAFFENLKYIGTFFQFMTPWV